MRNLNQLTKAAKHSLVTPALLLVAMLVFHSVGGVTRAQQPAGDTNTLVSSASDSQTIRASAADERYRIGPGDVLEVLVFNHPQLSRPALRVDGRGMIRMPLLEGEIKAACRTESELASDLTTRFQEYQKYPQVDVFVKEFNSQPVAVLGAVRTPGRFQLQRRVRLLEILTFSGGAAATAGETVQIVHGATAQTLCNPEGEAIPTEEDLVSYNLLDTLRGADSANPYLLPGDVVYVPNAAQIFVVGNVSKPAALPLVDELTVSRAIFMAGGLLPHSQSDKVRIIRKATPSSPRVELIVNLQGINKGSVEDVVLQPNDVVEVRKEGGAKAVLRGVMNVIIPTALSMPTRVVY
jgi:polysaccharide export outer membrane protein